MHAQQGMHVSGSCSVRHVEHPVPAFACHRSNNQLLEATDLRLLFCQIMGMLLCDAVQSRLMQAHKVRCKHVQVDMEKRRMAAQQAALALQKANAKEAQAQQAQVSWLCPELEQRR